MLRALHRRLPRFGFLTLFAAMLLFVSVAGWAKWNLDLWQEEEALLADLAKAGVGVTYGRDSGRVIEANPPAASQTWSVWHQTPPFLSRIDTIILRDRTSRDLLERAARLPFVELTLEEGPAVVAMPPETIAAKVGFDLQRPFASFDPANLPPLPEGDPIEVSEAAALISNFAESWSFKKQPPTRGSVDSFLAFPVPYRTFQARDESLRLDVVDGGFAIATPTSSAAFVLKAGGFEQVCRRDDTEQANYLFLEASPQMLTFDPQETLEANLERYGIDRQFRAALREPDRIRVERIDERTCRFDMPPIVLNYPTVGFDDAYSISLVARPDLDWALEGWDVQGVRSDTSPTPNGWPPVVSASYRGTLRREGDWVVPEEWAADRVFAAVLAAPPTTPRGLTPVRQVGWARYDFMSELDLSHVTPELFDAKMLPPRRELPWLRWYRVTFGLSLGLFAWVAVRKLAARRRVDESGLIADRAAA